MAEEDRVKEIETSEKIIMESHLQSHYRRIRFVLIIVLIFNWGVAIAKIIIGFLSKCTSMMADGFHSLSDGLSNIIGLVGIAVSSRPVDGDHPYGHKKYETFFSLGIAALLFLVAINLTNKGIDRLSHPVMPQVDFNSFAVMIITMAINIWVMNYEYDKGKRLRSDVLVADSMHTKADIFTSLSVVIALISIKLGYPILDPIATIIISMFIAYTGVGIVREASRVLCDTVVLTDVNKISNIVLNVKGVKACHKIRTRGRPDDICIDLHVQVDPAMHINEAHKISYTIEETLKRDIPEVTDVLVHIEPKEKTKK